MHNVFIIKEKSFKVDFPFKEFACSAAVFVSFPSFSDFVCSEVNSQTELMSLKLNGPKHLQTWKLSPFFNRTHNNSIIIL